MVIFQFAMLNSQRVQTISWLLLVAAIAASVSAVPAAAAAAAAGGGHIYIYK